MILTTFLSGCSTVRSAKLLVPTWFGFKEIQAGVFVDDEMPQIQQQEFLKTLNVAKNRVTVFFGNSVSKAKVFACSTEECFTSHGGLTARGKTYGASMLLLSPRGLDDVILSHELAHLELCNRIGVWRSMRSVPSWFDEGLAVFVSQDPRYTEQGWLRATENGLKAPKLNEIGQLLDNENWLLGYGTARKVVGNWYQQVGHAGLMQLIAEVSRGSDFDTSFQSIARRSSASNAAPQRDAPHD
ncbi:MAG: hypothetical protein FWF12_00950 [Betaproteobacteria bacterium]|nr:hypothetical protein [Betaproteobacteria bacterium]